MAISTSQVTITSQWQQVSDGDCTLQSIEASELYNVSIGADQPTDALIILPLKEPTTFAYKSPVWVRLNAKGFVGLQRVLNIIK